LTSTTEYADGKNDLLETAWFRVAEGLMMRSHVVSIPVRDSASRVQTRSLGSDTWQPIITHVHSIVGRLGADSRESGNALTWPAGLFDASSDDDGFASRPPSDPCRPCSPNTCRRTCCATFSVVAAGYHQREVRSRAVLESLRVHQLGSPYFQAGFGLMVR
jgi:hypothetical protein